MEKKEILRLAVWMGLMVFISSLMLGVGCSREQAPPPPPQAAAPAPAAPTPAAPAPAGPQTGAPPAVQPGAPGAPAANIAQIKTGMTTDQVKQIMGDPAQISQKDQMVEWKYYTPQKLEIKFQNNQVMAIETH